MVQKYLSKEYEYSIPSRTLKGSALVDAKLDSYKQLLYTEKTRHLTKGERKRKVELEQFLIRRGAIPRPKLSN